MEWWQATILGLVEGITEYLPISSTGHLILASHLLGLRMVEPATKSAVDAFNVVIQGGAILAVASLYWRRVVQMLEGLAGRDRAGRRLLANLAVAFLPTAVVGLYLQDWIERRLFHPGPVVGALVVGGVYMLLVERWRRGRLEARGAEEERGVDELSRSQALVIGLFQLAALWPGTSRSMMTITAGVIVGLRPPAAAEVSFLLGLPTLGAACLYKLATELLRYAMAPSGGTEPMGMFSELGIGPIVIGLSVATASAALAVRWLVGFLNRRGLSAFGWYRIVFGLVLAGLIAANVVEVG